MSDTTKVSTVHRARDVLVDVLLDYDRGITCEYSLDEAVDAAVARLAEAGLLAGSAPEPDSDDVQVPRVLAEMLAREHFDTCAVALSPTAGYPCTCGVNELSDLLAGGAR